MESELIKEVNAMEVLQKSRLFQGMSPEEINGVLGSKPSHMNHISIDYSHSILSSFISREFLF